MKNYIFLVLLVVGFAFADDSSYGRYSGDKIDTTTHKQINRLKGNFEFGASTWAHSDSWSPTIIIYGSGTIMGVVIIGSTTYADNAGLLSGRPYNAFVTTIGAQNVSGIKTFFDKIVISGDWATDLDIIGLDRPAAIRLKVISPGDPEDFCKIIFISSIPAIGATQEYIGYNEDAFFIFKISTSIYILGYSSANEHYGGGEYLTDVDAETLDTYDSLYFATASTATDIHDNYARKDSSPTWTGIHTFNKQIILLGGADIQQELSMNGQAISDPLLDTAKLDNNLNANEHKIINHSTSPTVNSDVSTKGYVDYMIKNATVTSGTDIVILKSSVTILQSSITVIQSDIAVLESSVTINTDGLAVIVSSQGILNSSVAVNSAAILVLESSATANADNIEILLSSATAIHDNYARLDSSPTWTGSHKFVQIEVDSITITSGGFVIVGTVTWSEDSYKLDGEHGSYYGVKDDIGFSTAANATDIYNLKVSTGNNKDRIYATEQATGTLLTKSSATATYVDKNYKGFVSTGAAGDEMAGKLTVLSTITVNYIQMGDIERGHLRGADNKEFRIETWGVSGKIKINHRAFPTSPYANFQWGATVINGFQGIRNGNLFLQTGGITYLTINSSGNIGIRTQNPGYGLEIATNTRIQYELHTTTIQAQNANGLYLTDENGVEHIGIYDDKTTLKSSTVTIPGYLDTEQAIKGWVKFDGTIDPPTINDSYNVTSVADSTGDGHYIITWIAPFSDADYCVTLCSNGESSYIQTMAAGSVTIFTADAAGTATDRSIVTVMAVGNR